MIVLAFDTSTFRGTVGWIRFEDSQHSDIVVDFAKLSLPAKPGHAERLLERVELVLDSGGHTIDDVDLIVFGRGPGTFTGLRIGMSTAKAFALSKGIPIVGVSTLEMVALCSQVEGRVVSLIDARRGELYGGAFDVTRTNGIPSARPLMEECVVSAKQLASVLLKNGVTGNITLAGDGIYPYKADLDGLGKLAPTLAISPDPYWMATVGRRRYLESGSDNIALVEPEYLRAPDAKLPSKAQK